MIYTHIVLYPREWIIRGRCTQAKRPFAARMRLGENLLTASNTSGASNNHTETAFRTSFENRVRRLKCRCFGGLWFERVVRIEVVEKHGRAAWRMGRRAWAGAAGPDVRPAICAADAPAQVRCCGSTKLQSLHVLLSDVAGGTAAMSASSVFNDRRWKAGTVIERTLQHRTGCSIATHRTAPKPATASKGSTIAYAAC